MLKMAEWLRLLLVTRTRPTDHSPLIQLLPLFWPFTYSPPSLAVPIGHRNPSITLHGHSPPLIRARSLYIHRVLCSLTLPVINTGPTPLCLFTVYAPAEHSETSVHKTKEEGDEMEESGKDEAPKWAKR